MFPRSAIAAFARYESPKYSRINGKQLRPGANDETNNCPVLKLGVPRFIPKTGNTKGVTKNNTTLRRSAISGNNRSEASTFTPSNAIKIVAGRARLRIITLIPANSDLSLSLTLSNRPIPINRRKRNVFCRLISIVTPGFHRSHQ